MTMPIIRDAAIPFTSPIIHWAFDSNQGNIAYDSVGDNDGNVYGAEWTDGLIGGALDFNGVGDYVEIANNSSQQISTNQITISAWIRLDEEILDTQKVIVRKNQGNYTI